MALSSFPPPSAPKPSGGWSRHGVLALVLACGLLLSPRPALANWDHNWWNPSPSPSSPSAPPSDSYPPATSERPSESNGWNGGYGSVGDWRSGRATNFGGPGDWWTLHQGSCGYGYLDQNVATGWDVAAMSDACYDYSGGCGKCYEIKCDPTSFKDGYGESLDRSGVCYDSSASVVVQVSDTCQCNYPANGYSNRRWCCGDMYHFDISTYTFEKLADKKWGVIGLKIRPVPCGHTPDKKAPNAPSPSPPNDRISRPWGWVDRRPWWHNNWGR